MAIEATVDRIVEATTRDLVWDAIRDIFAAHGFDRIIYADLRTHSQQILNSYPDTFGDYYADVCNPQDDPFFRYCCASLIPRQTGADYLEHYEYLTQPERQVILTAREAGMRSGFSCTFHKADDRGMGGWNIGSTLGRSEVEKFRPNTEPCSVWQPFMPMSAWISFGHHALKATDPCCLPESAIASFTLPPV